MTFSHLTATERRHSLPFGNRAVPRMLSWGRIRRALSLLRPAGTAFIP